MIQKHILDPFSLEILSGYFNSGDEITIDAADGTIRFLKS